MRLLESISRFIEIIDLCVSVKSLNINPPQAPTLPLIRYHGNTLRSRHRRMKDVYGLFPVFLSKPNIWSLAHIWRTGCCFQRRRAEFPLQKDKVSRVGYLPLPSPSLLLYSFGSAKSRGDMMQTLPSFSHTQQYLQKKSWQQIFISRARWLLCDCELSF